MDVDYVIIRPEKGPPSTIFIGGRGIPGDGDDSSQVANVRADGSLDAPGPKYYPWFAVTGLVGLVHTKVWTDNLESGLENDSPKKGIPFRKPRPKPGRKPGGSSGGNGSNSTGPGWWEPVGKGSKRKEV